MKTNFFLIVTGIFFVGVLCSSPAWCEETAAGDQQMSYERYIDEQIQHHEFKATLGSAAQPNLQMSARVSREKAAFLKKNREALISQMEANGVAKKPYKMSRYLNQTFYIAHRPERPSSEPVVVEAYEKPE